MAVGYRQVQVPDAAGAGIPMAVLYPTDAPPAPRPLGPFTLHVARDAAPRPGVYPLVLISHGTGGSPMSHRDMAHVLAEAGFVVGLPEHPFNNRGDNSLEGTVQNLVNRPRQLNAAIAWFDGDPEFAPLLKPNSISLIGHSMGAYTVLAVAGGQPTSLPHESADRIARPIAVEPDPRVRSVVLLAPATVWYRLSGALDGVSAPILMVASYADDFIPYFYLPQLVVDGVPRTTRMDYRLIEGAGHFSFISPFPPALTSPAFAPSQDPPGFDRVPFLAELNSQIVEFLHREA